LLKGLLEKIETKRGLDVKTKEKVDNVGILLASGLIAGEALLGLLFAGFAFGEVKVFHMFEAPSYMISVVCMFLIGLLLVQIPLKSVRVR
jgi:uncharacterized oligopeptide transporter (OPT) family protein